MDLQKRAMDLSVKVADELAAHISYLTVVHERKDNAPAGGNRTGAKEIN